ncbi:hypothetical protein [Colwellia sp. UCD-KL20]|uniref:hypothetical protein n=1 Tax=Colwellia sp. UCD-KL20 TaxID=1917165 RepID=UPI0025704338|nr:hypothetical protein [Colwellia sp. UCD-KL20]
MKYLILISVLLVSACSSTHKTPSTFDISDIMNIIALSEENAPNGIIGTFTLPIKASAIQRRNLYLNTEVDYRDRRNITVAISPKLIPAFTKKYGSSPERYFINKTVSVTGEAKRMKIYFFFNDKKNSKILFSNTYSSNVVRSNQSIKLI